MPSNELSALVAEMEAQHARLVAAVAEKDPDVLVQPQPNGRWTALENIRHMLFRDERS